MSEKSAGNPRGSAAHGASSSASAGGEPIAIVGAACLFPNAPGLKEFWRLIRRGEDAIGEVPASHWRREDYFDADPKTPDMTYCTRGGFLDPTAFDPTEWGVPPTAIEATDTAQLLGLVTAKAALEDAGYRAEPKPPAADSAELDDKLRDFDRDRTGVICGVTGTLELALPLAARLGHPKWRKALREAGVGDATAEDVIARIADSYVGWQENSFPGLLGNVVAGRIANRLDLRGTNCVVDAACASSLAAIHLAMLELQNGRADMIVSGGVDTLNDIFMFMCFSKTPALSPTGDARPFSDDADGTVIGEGVGMVALKRLDDARRDGDRIYAVIRGVGSSSDGRSQSIYAPRSTGQARALRDAYAQANVDPATIELIEAHGTGTKVGDAAEVDALRTVFGETGRKGAWCGLGSVKSQIGHTKAAAGVAGLIRAALALHHKVLPPTLKIRRPSAKLKLEDSPFYLNTTARPWPASENHPRRAAVSSFGFGGSNFHIVLEESDAQTAQNKTPRMPAWDGSVQIIALSAATRESLATALDGWIHAVEDEATPHELAARAVASRRSFSHKHRHRLALVHERETDLAGLLGRARQALADNREPPGGDVYLSDSVGTGRLAFLFPGQGSQYVDMLRDLASVFPEFRETLARAEVKQPLASSARARAHERTASRPALFDLIYPQSAFSDDTADAQTAALRRTEHAQPALGAVSLATLRLMERFGVRADFAAGHSFGELVALHAAGWYDENTLHNLSRERGRLMGELHGDRGAMLAVNAALDEISAMIEQEKLDVVIANRNSPGQGVLSGTREAIQEAVEACAARGYRARLLDVSAAFHSRLVVDAAKPFRAALDHARIAVGPAALPVYANSTGRRYPSGREAMRDLLGEQLARPVDFVSVVQNMYDAGARTFVELGPKAVLTGLVRGILRGRPHEAVAIDPSGGNRCALADFARALARLAALGHPVSLDKWDPLVVTPRKPAMVVPLVGANHRAPRKPRPPREASTPEPQREARDPISTRRIAPAAASRLGNGGTPIERAAIDNLTFDRGQPRTSEIHQSDQTRTTQVTAKTPDGNGGPPRRPEDAAPLGGEVAEPAADAHPGLLSDAFRIVIEGLHAMQTLQQQTAAIHKRFIEGQEMAHKTIHKLIESQQQLVERAMRTLPAASIASASLVLGAGNLPPVHTSDSAPDPTTAGPVPTQMVYGAAPADAPYQSAPAAFAPPPAQPHSTDPALDAVLLNVVSGKTGYPVEALTLDMHLEHELGIDSITRAEILAEMSERVPQWAAVRPEHVADAATLREFAARAAGVPLHAAPPTAVPAATPAPPPPRPADSPPAANTPATASFADALLEVVAELTGYPTEMLNLDMDMEADLGIDSIKRVEILATMEQRIPDFKGVNPEYMGSLRTLQQILDYVTEPAADGAAAAAPGNGGPPRPKVHTPSDAGQTPALRAANTTIADASITHSINDSITDSITDSLDNSLERQVLVAIDLPPAQPGCLAIAPGREIGVTDDGSGLSAALVRELRGRGCRARVIQLDSNEPAHAPADAAALGGLIITAPPAAVHEAADDDHLPHATEQFLKHSFQLVRRCGADLRSAAKDGGALLATVSRMDGVFGLSGEFPDALQGGLSGLVKSAAHEWPEVRCRALDVAATWSDPPAAAAKIVDELTADGPVETGLNADARRGLQVVNDPTDREGATGGLPASEYGRTGRPSRPPEHSADQALSAGDVVIITGGARGVTAETALALASSGLRPTLVLLGRSPEPDAEPSWLAGLTDEREIKRAIIAAESGAAKKPTPAEVQAAFRRHMAAREIRTNLRRLQDAGASVQYHAVDVRDSAGVRKIIADVQDKLGPVRAVVHGAGVLHDRLIEDKTDDQFDAVFDTKIAGLRNLLAAVDPRQLKALVLFSSVSGRFGRPGQVDYAMANEVLNKISQRFAARYPACRTVAINWGPWDGGMVDAALRRQFEREGVGVIPLAAGAQAMLRELNDTQTRAAEVLITARLDYDNPAITRTDRTDRTDGVDRVERADRVAHGFSRGGHESTADSSPPPLKRRATRQNSPGSSFEREVSLATDPYLSSHIIDGRPVLPLAITLEWLGHAALLRNRDKILHGFDGLRILKGVILDGQSQRVTASAFGRTRRDDGLYELNVELRGPAGQDQAVCHVRGRALLADTCPPPPKYTASLDVTDHPYTPGVNGAYETALFHGPRFQALERIDGCSPAGIVARVRSAAAPGEWMTNPPRGVWLADPLVLDACMQLGILWCVEQLGAPSLPSFIGSYRQYRPAFPKNGATVELRVSNTLRSKLTADLKIIDDRNDTVAVLGGVEWTVDASLTAAFERGRLTARAT